MQERLLREPVVSIPAHYLEFFRERQGELWTMEKLLEFHRSLPRARAATRAGVKQGLLRLRKHLPGEQKMITVAGPGGLGRMYGFVLFPQDQEITSLSQIGVSVFEDEPGELRVFPKLSVLSKRSLAQNPLVKPEAVISLFDGLTEEDGKTHRQSPLLTPKQRRLIAFLIEHPQGASLKELLAYGVGKNCLAVCRTKIGNRLQIYCIPARFQEEIKYFLIDKQKIGDRVRVPVVEEDELASLPEPARKIVDNLCNRLTVQSETRLRSSLTPPQRRLLLYLARHFGLPCAAEDLVAHVLQHRPFLSSDLSNIRTVKRHLQRALQGSEVSIFTISSTIPRYFGGKGAYILLPRNRFQGQERDEIPIVSKQDLAGVNERIRASIQKMCNRVRVKDLRLYPILGGLGSKKREIVLELATRFPKGCRSRSLSKELFPDSVSPEELLKTQISELRRIISKEFGDEIVIKYLFGEYRLLVRYGM